MKNEINYFVGLNNWNTGKLMHYQEGPLWHHSVALSDDRAITWKPEIPGYMHCRGKLEIYYYRHGHHWEVPGVNYRSKEDIIRRLLASVDAFHQSWDYDLVGWNCEHWARLVTSGDPVSYQVQDAFFGILGILGTVRNPESINRINRSAY